MLAYSLGLEFFAQVGSVVKSLKQNFVGLSVMNRFTGQQNMRELHALSWQLSKGICISVSNSFMQCFRFIDASNPYENFVQSV